MSALRIGTRGSALALWQARHVAELIGAQPGGPSVELVPIKTEGDLRTDVPLSQLAGRAFFTKEIDRALLAGEIDIAVHSLKDLSTVLEAGISLAAVLRREDARDALLAARPIGSLGDLPRGARVGTSSLRRRAFLAHARPDIVPLELRGNVPTRIEKLQRGEYDAIVLATAGLNRLGLQRHIAAHLSAAEFPPAVSQGAIGVCAREGDASAARWLHALDHGPTRLATAAERALLRRIEGGCQVPLGALAGIAAGRLSLQAAVCALDGSQRLDAAAAVEAGSADPVGLGERVAQQLQALGASAIIERQRAVQPMAELP